MRRILMTLSAFAFATVLNLLAGLASADAGYRSHNHGGGSGHHRGGGSGHHHGGGAHYVKQHHHHAAPAPRAQQPVVQKRPMAAYNTSNVRPAYRGGGYGRGGYGRRFIPGYFAPSGVWVEPYYEDIEGNGNDEQYEEQAAANQALANRSAQTEANLRPRVIEAEQPEAVPQRGTVTRPTVPQKPRPTHAEVCSIKFYSFYNQRGRMKRERICEVQEIKYQ